MTYSKSKFYYHCSSVSEHHLTWNMYVLLFWPQTYVRAYYFDIVSEGSLVDLTESMGNATTRALFNFSHSPDSWRENRFHICLIQEISETGDGRGGGGACVRVRVSLSVWERGETLGATGYLSRYNGVSYEKTSVNFLSDLQQSITQSSHSTDLWSCCLTESCHCSQPPTHRNSNFGLTNFPCNAIQLFFSLPLSSEPMKLGNSAYSRAKSKALAMCRAGPGSRKGGTGHFTSYQPTLNALIQP